MIISYRSTPSAHQSTALPYSLWARISGATYKAYRKTFCPGVSGVDTELAQTKVNELDVAFEIDKYILELQIAVYDTSVVEMLERERKLRAVEAGTLDGKFAHLGKVEEELAARAVFHDKVKRSRSLVRKL